MAGERPVDTDVLKLVGGDVAGVSSLGVLGDVLSHHIDLVSDLGLDSGQVNIGGSDCHVHLSCVELYLVQRVLREAVDKVKVAI